MGLSLQDRVALLPVDARKAWLAQQPDYILEEIARGEWWWVSRPEQVPPPGGWMICLALAGRGFGKLLALDTPISTSTGWTTMGQLQVGDQIFDESGHLTRITRVFDEEVPKTAYRLTFSDGTFLEAGGEHEWVTWDRTARRALNRSKYHDSTIGFPENWPTWRSTGKGRPDVGGRHGLGASGPAIRTTDEIVSTLTFGKREDLNHCIPVCGPLQLPPRRLALDPWLLGYWLGNGATRGSQLSMYIEDEQYVRSCVQRAGHDTSPNWANPYNAKKAEFSALGLGIVLRGLGVLGDKKIPNAYMRASVEQRKALLAGLLDSDGHINAINGIVMFSNSNEYIIDAVLELARSLGQKPVKTFMPSTLRENRKGNWLVTWRPSFNPMWNPRKAANYMPPGSQGLRNHHRMIVRAEVIPAQPMRCITVDSPNSLYLAGEGMIPTHNSRAGSEWIVNQVLKHPCDRHGSPTEWLVIAETLSDARTICMEGPAGILRVLERRKVKHRYKMSPRPMILFPNGSKIYTEGADDPDVGRGYSSSGSWLDEVAKWKYPKLSWDQGIMPSLRADLIGDHPRAFVTTTPKPIDLIQDWVKRTDGSVHIIRGSTFDNAANLSPLVIQELRKRYDGTAIGLQELYGEIIEAFEGALFNRLDIENRRIDDVPDNLVNIVVGVDPSLTGEDDEMGIVVVGRDRDNHLYVLADRSIMGVGRAAALEAWRVVADWGADMLICEVNLGKRWMQQVFNDAYYELVGQGLFERNTKPPLKGIDTKTGKRTRGEPVAMRCEQGKLHCVGRFPQLEDQMATFTSWGTSDSPDRLDALVHGCRYLMEGEKKAARITSPHEMLSTTLRSLWAEVGSYQTDF